jgi:hypothetical protein
VRAYLASCRNAPNPSIVAQRSGLLLAQHKVLASTKYPLEEPPNRVHQIVLKGLRL